MKLSEAMLSWLRGYRDGCQNGRKHKVNSVWTRGRGDHHRGLATCRKRGLITSHPDDHISKGGHRHDLTEAGRAVVDGLQVDLDRRQAEYERQRREVPFDFSMTGGPQSPLVGS